MFALDFESQFGVLLHGAPWALIACASFEDRCRAVAEMTSIFGLPTHCIVLYPIDSGSHWEAICDARQRENMAAITPIAPGGPVEFSLRSPDVHERLVSLARDFFEQLSQTSVETLVLDISAMPKSCFFPLIRLALEEARIKRVLVAYAEPAEYGSVHLHSDPLQPAAIPGHNFLVQDDDRDLAWIPVLGFGSFFAGEIHQALFATRRLGHRVFPLIGFPGFDPNLYARSLLDNGERLLRLLNARMEIRDQFIFAPASDPFATKDAILATMKVLPDVAWVGSPLGPRPMALGMLLAALERELTILVCPARSYHPEYSKGIGRKHLFPLRNVNR